TRGIIENYGTLRVARSTFSGNQDAGISNHRGVLDVVESMFSENIHAIVNWRGTVTISGSTFAGNRGDGIYNGGTLSVRTSTFYANVASLGGAIATHKGGTVTLYNTIVVGSDETGTCTGPMFDGGSNLQFPGKACGVGILTADPRLLPLRDNGGPTPTMALD